MSKQKILITGGLGFIGSALVSRLLTNTEHNIFNIDFNGYASDLRSVKQVLKNNRNYLKRYKFFEIDLSNRNLLEKIINKIQPDLIFHFAAESHVDRSIDDPLPFLRSNIIGTFNLLEVVKSYWINLSFNKKNEFKLIHISTDEVFGSLDNEGLFNETFPYNPQSPYAASKAAGDHLVNSWNNTYGIPTLICNCSNNYGPWQFPEKLIPTVIIKALKNQEIPIYGDGLNIRDWIYIEDHIDALLLIALKGESGENYCVGGNNQKTNIEIVKYICFELDKLLPKSEKYSNQINYVDDRPGHDKRYAINSSYIKKKLGWKPKHSFESSLSNTIKWYINNIQWCEDLLLKAKYNGERLGKIN